MTWSLLSWFYIHWSSACGNKQLSRRCDPVARAHRAAKAHFFSLVLREGLFFFFSPWSLFVQKKIHFNQFREQPCCVHTEHDGMVWVQQCFLLRQPGHLYQIFLLYSHRKGSRSLICSSCLADSSSHTSFFSTWLFASLTLTDTKELKLFESTVVSLPSDGGKINVLYLYVAWDMSQRLHKDTVSDNIFHVILSFFWNKKNSSTYELGKLTHYKQKQTIPNVWIKIKIISQCGCYCQTAEYNLLLICMALYGLTSRKAIQLVLKLIWTVIFFLL